LEQQRQELPVGQSEQQQPVEQQQQHRFPCGPRPQPGGGTFAGQVGTFHMKHVEKKLDQAELVTATRFW
jgi:hypothetical protein